MTTDELDKFVADSVTKGYDEALVLAGQMSLVIQDIATSSPTTFSELVRFASCISSRYEKVIEERATAGSPHDLKLLTTAVEFIAEGGTFGEMVTLPSARIRYALDLGPGRSKARALCKRLGVICDTVQ